MIKFAPNGQNEKAPVPPPSFQKLLVNSFLTTPTGPPPAMIPSSQLLVIEFPQNTNHPLSLSNRSWRNHWLTSLEAFARPLK